MLKNVQKNLASIFILFSLTCLGQNEEIKPPKSFFPQSTSNVFIVGTFHFHYPNLDVQKAVDSHKIDVLEEPTKSQVTELVEYIKIFQPTKVAIEATVEWNAPRKLQAYKRGEYRSERDERFQLGLRIAHELNLDTIYSIDSTPFSKDLKEKVPEIYSELIKDFDFQSSDPYEKYISEWLKYEDGIKSKVNLLEYFRHLNSREYHLLTVGSYLIGDFKLDSNRGADVISFWWYNRNLRMFRNIQEIVESEKDRILIIVGNGHAAVLRHLVESSPEFEFIEFGAL